MRANFVYLASCSPRRRDLLGQIGVQYRQLEATIDESVLRDEEPTAYVLRLAYAKAEVGWKLRDPECDAPVLAADTAVIGRNSQLGKPKNRDDAHLMLQRLSGRRHSVFTAVALKHEGGIESRLSRTEVELRGISPAEARRYWESGEPEDKAGGYAIQGLGGVFVADLRGSYSGVMGLPLFETAELLDFVQVPRWTAGVLPRA